MIGARCCGEIEQYHKRACQVVECALARQQQLVDVYWSLHAELVIKRA
jgi:hypothetical protein